MNIYDFAWRVERAYSRLPLPLDALEALPGSSVVLDDIIKNGPDTWQSKPANVAQIKSLMKCVCNLLPDIKKNGAMPLVLDIGAGKALFTRAIYEALGREVPVVALDSRRAKKRDQFYDPCEKYDTAVAPDDAPYTRIVADVRYLAARTVVPLDQSKNGGVIAITKHLCGGATDGSIVSLCKPPLANFVGACCFAPCCHQKMRRDQYCNMPYLNSLGFCKTHVGMRGQLNDTDYRNFIMLISFSKSTNDLKEYEYKTKHIPKVLGVARSRELGRKARRILEEGRIEYLRDRGFDSHLVRYCDTSVTFDNLAIIAKKRINYNENKSL